MLLLRIEREKRLSLRRDCGIVVRARDILAKGNCFAFLFLYDFFYSSLFGLREREDENAKYARAINSPAAGAVQES